MTRFRLKVANRSRHGLQQLQYKIEDKFNQVLSRLDDIRPGRISTGLESNGENDAASRAPFVVPQEISHRLLELAEAECYDFSKMPIIAGLESAIYHMDQATGLQNRNMGAGVENEYESRVLSLMKAKWILERTIESDEYSDACSYQPVDRLENKMMQWGMTVQAFTEKLQQVSMLSTMRGND